VLDGSALMKLGGGIVIALPVYALLRNRLRPFSNWFLWGGAGLILMFSLGFVEDWFIGRMGIRSAIGEMLLNGVGLGVLASMMPLDRLTKEKRQEQQERREKGESRAMRRRKKREEMDRQIEQQRKQQQLERERKSRAVRRNKS
jgi:hypothetical protein